VHETGSSLVKGGISGNSAANWYHLPDVYETIAVLHTGKNPIFAGN